MAILSGGARGLAFLHEAPGEWPRVLIRLTRVGAELLIELAQERTPASVHITVPTRLVPLTSTKRKADTPARR